MPTWEFNELRRKYVEKHGYTVTIPGLEDIFHFKAEKPLTAEEQYHWKRKNRSFFDEDRYEEIRYMKQRRKEKFLAMLSSPSPHIFGARAAIITSLDDTQDALSTLSGIGTLAYMGLGKIGKALIRGPLGWLMTAETGINYVTKGLSPELRPVSVKPSREGVTKMTPKARKAHARKREWMEKEAAKKGKEARDSMVKKSERMLKAGKWQGRLIETAQTTDSVFGTGISLGALMNLPIDFVSGFVRTVALQKVDMKFPTIDIPHWQRVARKNTRDFAALEAIRRTYLTQERRSPVVTIKHDVGIETVLSDQEIAEAHVALFLSTQTMHMMADTYDPSDLNLPHDQLELKAPLPTNVLTLEVIKEAGDDPEEGSVWPSTGEKWSNARDLVEENAWNFTDNLNHYCNRNAHSEVGRCVSGYSVDAALYNYENYAGLGVVDIEHTPASRAISSLQALNFCVDQDLTSEQKQVFAEYLQRCNDQNYTPGTREILQHAERHCGFSFVQFV
jgi:hypothetical protein